MSTYSLNRPINKAIHKAVYGPIGAYAAAAGGGPTGYDTDAQDFFTRAEAVLADAFDLTSANALYTADYTKSAWNDAFVAMKNAGVWSKVNEIYPLGGIRWAGIEVKAKYLTNSTLTNNLLTSGQYTLAGAGMGYSFTGSGGVYMACNNDFPSDYSAGISMGCYFQTLETTSFLYPMGWSGASASPRVAIRRGTTGGEYAYNGGILLGDFTQVGSVIGTSRSATDHEVWNRKTSVATDATDASTQLTGISGENLSLGRLGAWNSGYTTSDFAFAWVGTGFTTADNDNMSDIIHAFATALGGNAY